MAFFSLFGINLINYAFAIQAGVRYPELVYCSSDDYHPLSHFVQPTDELTQTEDDLLNSFEPSITTETYFIVSTLVHSLQTSPTSVLDSNQSLDELFSQQAPTRPEIRTFSDLFHAAGSV